MEAGVASRAQNLSSSGPSCKFCWMEIRDTGELSQRFFLVSIKLTKRARQKVGETRERVIKAQISVESSLRVMAILDISLFMV